MFGIVRPCLHRKPQRCGACSQKAQCTTGQYKYLAIHIHEPSRQRARDLANTPGFASAQRERKKVEALFANLRLRSDFVASLRRLSLCEQVPRTALPPSPFPLCAREAWRVGQVASTLSEVRGCGWRDICTGRWCIAPFANTHATFAASDVSMGTIPNIQTDRS